MAHYAKVLDNLVTQVIVAEEDFFKIFVDSSPGEWIQTSYNTYGGIHYNPDTKQPSEDQSKALRKNYAGVGFTYNIIKDVFIPPKPFASWVLDEETCLWNPPIPKPEGAYYWNENSLSWKEINLENP
jgi:hypothetical protein